MAFNNIDVDARFKEILKSRANRLGISVEEVRARANEEPRSTVAMRELAAARGQSPGALLEHAIQTALQSDYPTPLCLQASDLEAYLDRAGLAQEVLDHVPTCPGCLALLEMIREAPPTMPVPAKEQDRNPYGWLRRILKGEYASISASQHIER